jgi:hypothetical protein
MRAQYLRVRQVGGDRRRRRRERGKEEGDG